MAGEKGADIPRAIDNARRSLQQAAAWGRPDAEIDYWAEALTYWIGRSVGAPAGWNTWANLARNPPSSPPPVQQ